MLDLASSTHRNQNATLRYAWYMAHTDVLYIDLELGIVYRLARRASCVVRSAEVEVEWQWKWAFECDA
jgi:hypothetical protein